ncbi:CHASE3 domain-containing protein [Mucilaginibacter sp.]|uniref:sensor histidine kinase n=1 Tax=Mucilaginibacter sp. TaxID=1882438 RepID=UPI00284FD0EB|nr:CHASE3 domain-containing protein [Mucilaginibacter sp.]MDR3693573.1 CHASE3 domain-containing protein [Mucilaginibacter sp.]
MVRHTEQVIYQSGNVLSIAKDIETSTGGFVITNDSAFLKPFFPAEKNAFTSIGELKRLTRDNPKQKIRIDSLEVYMHKLLDFSTKIIAIRSKQGLTPAITYVSNRQGKYYDDQIRQISSVIQQTENGLLSIRKKTNGHSQMAFKQLSRVIFISMVAFTILLLILIDRYFLQNKEKEKRTIELALANEERTKMVSDLMLRNMDLEQFAYIISHNLRAPVANIIGASSVLNDNDLSLADKQTIFEGINVSVTRLDEVVKDLNHILQVKGDINETKEIVHFSTLVEEIKSSIQNLIGKYNIEITYDFSAIDGFLTLRGYLYSIFYNLISNSIKYRRKEIHSIIEVKSRLVNNKLELTFSDNGMGINLKKNRDQVFGLYKRFHSIAEGKGLGLFMVKTQVQALGGKISVESLENEGTEFKIEFNL